MKTYDLVIIGGGPAGIATAISANANSVSNILIIEREKELGGILNQCIHNGFGWDYFNQDLTGPEYSNLLAREVENNPNIDVMLDSSVVNLKSNLEDKIIHIINSASGLIKIKTKTVVVATGCRELPRAAAQIYGSRSALGIYSAGAAQKLMNVHGYNLGKDIVILGSGDVGLIVARHLTLMGAKVHAVIEPGPQVKGLPGNVEQCLTDFAIPLFLNHAICKIHGKEKVHGVSVIHNIQEKFLPCDTIILSTDLVPEAEFTKRPGVFICGNAQRIHSTVDLVVRNGFDIGVSVAQYLGKNITNTYNYDYNETSQIENNNTQDIYLKTINCICCPLGCKLNIYLAQNSQNKEITVVGNQCLRGKNYALNELTSSKRIVTGTINISNRPLQVLSVKTSKPVDKQQLFTIMEKLTQCSVTAPIDIGKIIIKNVADTDADIIATRSVQ